MMQTMSYDLAPVFVFFYILTNLYGLGWTLQDGSQEKIANEYIVDKWRQWYKQMDLNHKGEISRGDIKDEGESFPTLNMLDTNQKNLIQGETDRLIETAVFRGRSRAISVDEFVKMNTKRYTDDQAKFKDEMENM